MAEVLHDCSEMVFSGPVRPVAQESTVAVTTCTDLARQNPSTEEGRHHEATALAEEHLIASGNEGASFI